MDGIDHADNEFYNPYILKYALFTSSKCDSMRKMVNMHRVHFSQKRSFAQNNLFYGGEHYVKPKRN